LETRPEILQQEQEQEQEQEEQQQTTSALFRTHTDSQSINPFPNNPCMLIC
jgi:hypothetical protein